MANLRSVTQLRLHSCSSMTTIPVAKSWHLDRKLLYHYRQRFSGRSTALALQHKPAAILLDLMMPKYSGFEVCQTLSSLSFPAHIPARDAFKRINQVLEDVSMEFH